MRHSAARAIEPVLEVPAVLDPPPMPFPVTRVGAGAPRDARQQRLFREGVRFAPIFHGFVRFVIERLRERGHSRLYYLTREGEFFRAIHERIADVQGSASVPAPLLLEVSRRSTFAASLTDVTPEALMRLWTLYSTQSLRGLFGSLNVDPAGYAVAVARHGLTLDERIVYPWTDARVCGLLGDPDVALRLRVACARQRDLLLRYCRSRRIDAGTPEVALVDIGWRGTIQDNLAHVLPSVHFDGCYLGLLRYLNPQPANASKTAFGPDENADGATADLLRYVTPYEMLTNSSSGSVTGYMDSLNGVRPVRTNQAGEDVVHRRYTQAFQEGVLHAVPQLEEDLRVTRRTPAARRVEVLRLWHGLSFDPPRPLGSAYLDLVHDETFGMGSAVPKHFARPTGLVARAMVSSDARRELERWLDDTSWPAGVLAAHRLRFPALLALRRRSLVPPPDGFDRTLQTRAGVRRWRHAARSFARQRVCCYGAGAFAAAVVRNRDLSLVNIVGFVDRDAAKAGKRLGVYPIVGAHELAALQPDVVLVTVFRNPPVVEAVKALVRESGLTCSVVADIWE